MQTLEFQQSHLDRVSRSFAFCIRRLPQPLRGWVGLTYLICRILDTIEDSKWPSSDDQKRMFERFESAIKDPALAESLFGWDAEFPEVTDGERILLRDAALIVQDFHDLPPNLKQSIQDLVLSMSSGMRHFLKDQKSGFFRLNTLKEVNQYCFFVAGLVGEALTRMVSSVEPRFPLSRPLLLRAHHFGLFLQKVNILKDQVKDEENGRWLVPSREEVESSVCSDAQEALEFLCSIPKEQVEFRQFCGWSLFLGLETLLISRASIVRRLISKVSRSHTEKLMKQVDEIITDNQRLHEFFGAQAERLNWRLDKVPRIGSNSPEWLSGMYRGSLDPQSLAQLGI